MWTYAYTVDNENQTHSLFDLLKDWKPPKKGSERGELLTYFSKEIGRPVKYIGIRMAHYSVDQIYGLKSAYKDRLVRPCGDCLRDGATGACKHSNVTAQKYWWWITKTTREEKLQVMHTQQVEMEQPEV
jgi:hypothetical protein